MIYMRKINQRDINPLYISVCHLENIYHYWKKHENDVKVLTNFYFDRAVNCQPSYRAWPRIAEVRALQPSFYYSFPYFFAPGTPIFTKKSLWKR